MLSFHCGGGGGGGLSDLNFGQLKSEVSHFRGWLSGLKFQRGALWRIWTQIYCSYRNLFGHRMWRVIKNFKFNLGRPFFNTTKLKYFKFEMIRKNSEKIHSKAAHSLPPPKWKISDGETTYPPPSTHTLPTPPPPPLPLTENFSCTKFDRLSEASWIQYDWVKT